jgi:hypothetical protein
LKGGEGEKKKERRIGKGACREESELSISKFYEDFKP